MVVWVHTTAAPSMVPLFPRLPGGQRCGPGGLGGGLGGGTRRTVVVGTTVVVGSMKVVVVAGLLGVVIEEPDEGAALVDVGADVGSADAVAFFAIALDSP